MKNLFANVTVVVGLIAHTVSAQANSWKEYIVTPAQEVGKKQPQDFRARVSFTTRVVAPNIGMPYGALTVGLLYVELFNNEKCPAAVLIASEGRKFPIKMTIAEGKCFGRLDDFTLGVLTVSDGKLMKVAHGNMPLVLKRGGQMSTHQLIVQEGNTVRQFQFRLNDSIQ